MDFRELRYVVAVADCSSITQAARQLFISQPSLSYALGQIEKEMGVKLFDRSRQPLVLTEAGRLYVKTARHILQEERELKNRLTDLKDGQGAQIRLGIPSERPNTRIPNSASRKPVRRSCWNSLKTTGSTLSSVPGTKTTGRYRPILHPN